MLSYFYLLLLKFSPEKYIQTEHSVLKLNKGYIKISGSPAATKFGVKLHLFLTVLKQQLFFCQSTSISVYQMVKHQARVIFYHGPN